MPVLEDAAQAAGSIGPAGRPGALGTIATFSFYPSKNLGAFGDGGAITTRDADARRARAHAALPRLGGQEVTTPRSGYNSRLDELQAAILRVQLPELDRWASARARGGRPVRGGRSAGLVDTAAGDRRRAARVAPVRDPPPGAPTTLQAALAERGDRRARATTARPVHRQPPMRQWAPPRRPARDRRGGAHAPGDPDVGGAERRAGGRGRRPPCATRLGARLVRPHQLARTSSSCARSSRRCAPTGAEVAGDRARLRADRRAVRALRHRRARSSAATAARGSAAKAVGLADRSLALARWARGRRFDLALGHGSNDVTRRGARRCASRARRCSTTSGRRCSTRSTAGSRRRSSCPRRSRPSAWTATARARKLHRYPGLKEEYYLADFEPDPAVLGAARASTRPSRSPSCARRRRSRSTTASRTTSSARC